MSSQEKAIIIKKVMRIIPYYIHQGRIMILLGVSATWHDWVSLGGVCKGTKPGRYENLKSCLRRELREESKHLLDLDEHFDFNNCKTLKYTILSHHADYGDRYNFENTVYFVEWIGNISTKDEILSHFDNSQRDKKLKNHLTHKYKNDNFTLEKELSAHFEMSHLDFIQVNSSRFREYIINTLAEYKQRVIAYKDLRLESYLDPIFQPFIQQLSQSDQNPRYTNDKRFDVKFLGGLIAGLLDIYQGGSANLSIKSPPHDLTIDDVIEGFKAFLEDQSQNCQYQFQTQFSQF